MPVRNRHQEPQAAIAACHIGAGPSLVVKHQVLGSSAGWRQMKARRAAATSGTVPLGGVQTLF
jgi:hypothetical protein